MEFAAAVNFLFLLATLENTKNIFLFACYTGLSYVDVKYLTTDNLIKGVNGKDWIYCRREKSQIPMKIPLLEKAINILAQYRNSSDDKLLPVYSNRRPIVTLKKLLPSARFERNSVFTLPGTPLPRPSPYPMAYP